MDRSQTLKVGILAALGLCLVGAVLILRPGMNANPASNPAASADAVNPGLPKAPRSPAQCAQCEQQQCPVLATDCQSAECKAAVACFEKTKCAPDEDHLYFCYCGDMDKTECFSGPPQPKGPCKAELEAAAKSTKPLEVGQRFFDRDTPYASGQAMQLAACVLRNCPGCP